MAYALVVSGVVEKTVENESDMTPESNGVWEQFNGPVAVGWTFDGNCFLRPTVSQFSSGS